MGSGYFLGILLTDIDVNEPDDQTGVLDVDRPFFLVAVATIVTTAIVIITLL